MCFANWAKTPREHLSELVSALVLNVESARLQRDAIEAGINGNVERLLFFTDAELDVTGQANGRIVGVCRGLARRSGGDEADFFAGGIEDHYAGATRIPDRQVDVAIGVNTHSIAALLFFEIDENAVVAGLSQEADCEGVDFHRALRRWRLCGIYFVGAVVMVGNVQSAAIGA